MLFSLPIMYNCICILPFLGFKDTSFANFASTSHVFDNVRMLPIKILHLQSTKISCRRYLPPLSFEFYLLHNLSQYITYKKIDIRNSSEYGVSVGDTQSVNFCVNEFERTCLKLRSSKFEFKFICFQQKFTLLCVTRSWNLSKNSYINFL